MYSLNQISLSSERVSPMINSMDLADASNSSKHTYHEVFLLCLADMKEMYIEDKRSPRTVANFIGINKKFILDEDLPYDSLANRYVEDLTISDIKKLKHSINKAFKYLSHARLTNVLIYIDKVLYFAVDLGYMHKIVYDAGHVKARGRAKDSSQGTRNFLSEKEYALFCEVYNSNAFTFFKGNKEIRINRLHEISCEIESIASFRSLLYKALFDLVFYTGARKSEARGLKWIDVIVPNDDFELYRIKIDKQYSEKGAYVLDKDVYTDRPKTDSSVRICVLHESCSESLLRLQQFLIVFKMYDANNYIFMDFYCKTAKPIPETNIDRCFRYMINTMKIEERSIVINNIHRHITLHGLRHSACTCLLEKGMEKHDVANFLGHKNTKMVDEIYAHFITPSDEEEGKLQRNIKFFKNIQ